ncbi:hypothetical protein [Undibacterium sp. RuTC16W]|uniref:hypothetical protein n=1 Tax=Undibacterium sp. RuTC16W TaxID=3413048 RepID=UPI003BF44817
MLDMATPSSQHKLCDQKFGLKMFPSIAPQFRIDNLSGNIFSKGDCVEMPIKNATHIVGKD